MSDDELTELRSLNEARAAAGDPTAAAVLRLVDAYEKSRARLAELLPLIRGMGRRIADQSDLLSRRAEK